MNRIDRVTAILIQLQSRRVVRAQEIAERFNISLRTVYRDIKTLEEAGIPLTGEPGIGYSIMEGYRLPPVIFNKEEATALVIAEKIVEKYTDKENFEAYRSALFKVKAVLRSAEKEFVEDIDETVAILGNYDQQPPQLKSQSLQLILGAIAGRYTLRLVYQSAYAMEQSERTVDPIGVFLQNGNWHLIAWCNLKNDYRDFRLDRMQSVSVGDPYTRQHPTLNEYLDKIARESDVEKVVIRVDKLRARYIVSQKYYYGFVSEQDLGDEVEMTFLSASLEAFARWYLAIAANARIVQPLALKGKIKDLLSAIYQNS